MPEQTIDQRERLIRFRTEPEFHHIVEGLAHRAVDVTALRDAGDRHRAVKFYAALDFFLIHVAFVADPDEIEQANCNPFDFTVLADGRAKYTREVPTTVLEKYGEPVLYPDQFILLQPEVDADGPLPPFPKRVGDDVEGVELWLELWKKAEVKLDAFLTR